MTPFPPVVDRLYRSSDGGVFSFISFFLCSSTKKKMKRSKEKKKS
jgi:hypothetical protein